MVYILATIIKASVYKMTMNNNTQLPNFLIVGAARSGTTSLYNYLKQHPDIFMSKIKEPCFFICAGETVNFNNFIKVNYICNYNDYTQLYVNAVGFQCIGEASTPYLFLFKKAIHNIKKYIPESNKLKIIIILRNPVERAFSQFMALKRYGLEVLSFENAVSQEAVRKKQNYHFDFFYVGRGFYYEQVRAYLMNFRNVKIYLFEELKHDPDSVISDLLGFLEVDRNVNLKIQKKHNFSGVPTVQYFDNLIFKDNAIKTIVKKILPSSVRKNIAFVLSRVNLKKGNMDSEIRAKLIEMYREDMEKLSLLIDRDLSSWMRTKK